jgi:ubiquitin carboxyl-terminal hydrolase 12/46
LQALYFCKPFREKIIQYKLAYNQRIASLSNKDISNNNNSSNNDSNDNNNNNSPSNNFNVNYANGNEDSLHVNNSNINKDNKSVNNLNNNNSSQQQLPMLKQEHLLNCLAELFYSIVTMKKKKGIVQPKKFIARLRKDNDAFDNLFQQDAHEFLNYLLNTCADILKEEMKELKELKRLEEQNNESNIVRLNTKANKALNKLSNGALSNHHHKNNQDSNKNNSTNGSNKSLNSINSKNDNIKSNNNNNNNNKNEKEEELTWIHELFQGILVNETKCLNCETSSSKEENFLDLSVDVEQNTSISHCLQEFSNMEMLCGECKYYCETCSSKQEAEKRFSIQFIYII